MNQRDLITLTAAILMPKREVPTINDARVAIATAIELRDEAMQQLRAKLEAEQDRARSAIKSFAADARMPMDPREAAGETERARADRLRNRV